MRQLVMCSAFIVLLQLLTAVFAREEAAKEDAKQAPAKAPAVLLAQVYQRGIDVTQYLISEKYDGIRAVWDGQTLRTRAGNLIATPSWFTEPLPKTALDGELWVGRSKFEQTASIVRKLQPVDSEWKQVKYMIFELPGSEGTFEQRVDSIQKIVASSKAPHLQAVAQSRVASEAALQKQLKDIVAQGGEGLMLHRADAPYVTGRSDVLLKLKLTLDAEATVIAHEPGKGKFAGMLGALRVRTAEGIEFKLGTGFSDEQRRSPPAIGATVTFTYRDVTSKGVPRFASFLRVRTE